MTEPSPFYQQLPGMENVQPIEKKSADQSMSRELEYLYEDMERLVTQIRLNEPSALTLAEDLRDAIYRLLR